MTIPATTLLLGLLAPPTDRLDPAPPAPDLGPPRVEVAFVLDTTGSMSGLIEGAKQKIWSIANRIADGDPVPDVRFGLVAYRDIGDAYVTDRVPLTEDLDHVFNRLMGFEAAGGGDGPEHVNAALHDAVFGMEWTEQDDRVLKLVFLVGDAPPHMDYDDGKDYREICTAAVERGLIINTVRCGGDAQCAEYWRDIARRSEGRFTSIDASGGMTSVATPVDERLAQLNIDLARTGLGYGSDDSIRRAEEKASGALTLPASAAADRAEYAHKKGGRVDAVEADLIDALREGKVELEELEDEELPEPLRGLDVKERGRKVAEITAERDALLVEIGELSAERQRYLAEKANEAKADADAGFDAQVLEMLRDQAKDKGIGYPKAPEPSVKDS